MPKQVFLNLNQDKQNKIIDALFNLLKTNTIKSLSINQLCLDAGIAHGSFYAYFDHKNDLLDYAFKTIISSRKEGIKKQLNASHTWIEFIEVHFDTIVKMKNAKSHPVDHYLDYVLHKSEQDLDSDITPFAFSYIEITDLYAHLFAFKHLDKMLKVIRMSRILLEYALHHAIAGMDIDQVKLKLIDDLSIYEKGLRVDGM